jgi:hypothetical protein
VAALAVDDLRAVGRRRGARGGQLGDPALPHDDVVDGVDPLARVADVGAADDELRRAGGRGRDELHRHASCGSGTTGPVSRAPARTS